MRQVPTSNELITAGNNEAYLFKKNGNTADIIEAITEGDKVAVSYVSNFAHTLEGATVAETCANIWDWVHSNIPYREDNSGQQLIQLPGQLYNNRHTYLGGTGSGGDCKSMSLFCSAILRSLGNYNFKYRFISENRNENYHHVYLIVQDTDTDGSPCYIPLDCTLKEFGVEVPYAKKSDLKPTAAGMGYSIGATQSQAQADESYWRYETEDLQKNFWPLVQTWRKGCMTAIFNEWARRAPIKYSEFEKAFLKNYESFIDMGSTLLYYFWNDKNSLSYTACRGRGATHFTDIPFPADYAAKMQTAKEFVENFKTLGLRDGDLRTLCALGTFRKYGVGLDYMLYRCYCIELYGQPFAPVAGIPYWSNATGTFIVNDAAPNDAIKILLCFPAQGGVGRPYGEPYWSTGGHVINNGATDAAIEKWLRNNPKPGTAVPSTVRNAPDEIVPGVIIAQLTFEEQLAALAVYNDWAKGNMVMLPQPSKASLMGKPHMGDYGISAAGIVAIVVAVVSAVATVATVVAKLVETFKKKNGDELPLPTMDFKWDYQTADGCLIGHCVNVNGCSGAQTAKMCNGVIVQANPNPADPNNQPADPGSFFGGTNPKKTLMVAGGGLIALGGAVSLMRN